MKIIFEKIAWSDLEWWMLQNLDDRKRLLKLLEEIKRTPREGTWRPERLKHLSGEFWSRRFNIKHRILYQIDEDTITYVQLRGHYWYDR